MNAMLRRVGSKPRRPFLYESGCSPEDRLEFIPPASAAFGLGVYAALNEASVGAAGEAVPVRVISESPWHAAFARNMLQRPESAESLEAARHAAAQLELPKSFEHWLDELGGGAQLEQPLAARGPHARDVREAQARALDGRVHGGASKAPGVCS